MRAVPTRFITSPGIASSYTLYALIYHLLAFSGIQFYYTNTLTIFSIYSTEASFTRKITLGYNILRSNISFKGLRSVESSNISKLFALSMLILFAAPLSSRKSHLFFINLNASVQSPRVCTYRTNMNKCSFVTTAKVS